MEQDTFTEQHWLKEVKMSRKKLHNLTRSSQQSNKKYQIYYLDLRCFHLLRYHFLQFINGTQEWTPTDCQQLLINAMDKQSLCLAQR